MSATTQRLHQIYQTLFTQHGEQHWWPGDTPFEIMVGAVLAQSTAWSNVERAIGNLAAKGKLDPHAILHARHYHFAAWIKPSGYFNVKAKRLKNLCRWYI